ncbi:unnamed protein product [Pleuronectes platessa]|uniref:Uncharacterized protein n=1 Tax=Pleuronectes platessa TaxID=8262 RepID=A0A9N7TRJ2_PLEPL|nr:unnamed protein product [Pleuronectes platessa]
MAAETVAHRESSVAVTGKMTCLMAKITAMSTCPVSSAASTPQPQVLNPSPAPGEDREGKQDFADISPPSPLKLEEIKPAWVALSETDRCQVCTLGIEGNKKLHPSSNTSNSPTTTLLCPPSRQSSFFLGWLRF